MFVLWAKTLQNVWYSRVVTYWMVVTYCTVVTYDTHQHIVLSVVIVIRMQKYNFACCFVWVQNLIVDNDGRR